MKLLYQSSPYPELITEFKSSPLGRTKGGDSRTNPRVRK